MNYLTGPIPLHQYVYVDATFIHKEKAGFMPAVWFGLVAYPGRLWGCTVMLECGAIYRNIPLHALATRDKDVLPWTEKHAATWDVYGYGWSACIYPYLHGLECELRTRAGEVKDCEYLFSVSPIGDGFSAVPEQSKEFTFVKCETHGRLSAQPTDKTLFVDRSFTNSSGWPSGMKRQTQVYSCEGPEVTSVFTEPAWMKDCLGPVHQTNTRLPFACCQSCFVPGTHASVMTVCSNCGNKRCPKAENHKFKCTNSNEVGQVGEPEVTSAPENFQDHLSKIMKDNPDLGMYRG